MSEVIKLREQVLAPKGQRAVSEDEFYSREYREVNGEIAVCMHPGNDCLKEPSKDMVFDVKCREYDCAFAMLVCQGHEGQCDETYRPHPQYNPFKRERFDAFCREMSRLEKKADEGE